MSDPAKIATQIMAAVGGIQNVKSLTHCATRLRFTLRDKQQFNQAQLEKMPEVLSTVVAGDKSQVVIGANVTKYYAAIQQQYQLHEAGEPNQTTQAQEKNLIKRILNAIVSIMAPIITVLIAGGMFKVVIAILALLGLDPKSTAYLTLSFMADAAFYFLPFMLAVSAAKKFNTNTYLAMMMAGVLLHPNFTALVAAGKPIALFGAPIRLASYGGSVIPIILIVWFMSYVERFAEKVAPNMIKNMLKPLLVALITAPIALIVIGPIGSLLGDGLYTAVTFINQHTPWLVPTLVGAFTPLLVMVGMHVSLLPLATLSMTKFGSETIMGPGMLAINIAQAGAAAAIAVREKQTRGRQIALSASVTALSGITEPALYGVTLKYKHALTCVVVSGGLAGLFAGLTGLVRYSFGSPGIFTLPVFIGANPTNFRNALLTVAIAFGATFLSTYFFATVETNASTSAKTQPQPFQSVVAGEMIPLARVQDEVFAAGTLGHGVAIIPESGTIVAPADATVSMLYPTNHAIGLTTASGQEVLIHIGIDTVRLDGRFFKPLVSQGESVKVGQPLIKINLPLIEKSGFDPTVIVLLPNTPPERIEVHEKTSVCPGDKLFSFIPET